MSSISRPDPGVRAAEVLKRAQAGEAVDITFAQGAIGTAGQLELPAARALVQDLLTTSTTMTPKAREALEAFIAASGPQQEEPPLLGALVRWIGQSPPPARNPNADKMIVESATIAASSTLQRSGKKTLAEALAKIDPVVAQTVLQDSKYSKGLAGLTSLFPTLATALSSFEAAHEPGLSLMTALLSSLPQPRPMAELGQQVRGGAVIDRRLALELMRASHAEHTPAAKLSAIIDGARTTEAGKALIEGWTSSNGGSVEWRYTDALRSMHAAREPLRTFNEALADLDPKRAALGHTELLTSGKHPALKAAFNTLRHGDTDVENWSPAARELLKEALAQDAQHGASWSATA